MTCPRGARFAPLGRTPLFRHAAVVDIRAYGPHDAPTLALLLGELGHPASAEQAAEYAGAFVAHPGASLLVAVEDGAVVGAAASALVPRLGAERLSCRIT